VTPDLLDDVFLLHLALEATKGILQRLTLLQSNFCQSDHLPTGNQSRTLELTSFVLRSVEPAKQQASHKGSGNSTSRYSSIRFRCYPEPSAEIATAEFPPSSRRAESSPSLRVGQFKRVCDAE
jgi:hypothetical protein